MASNPHDKRILAFFILTFFLLTLWGYASGELQTLFKKRSSEEVAAIQQRALEHVFGSDQTFDPAADNVVTAAGTRQDNVTWKTLAHARLRMGKSKAAPEGVDFDADVQKLDGQAITLTGYMFPLEASGSQAHFLLSAYPPSCPYCVPGGPTELIEITDSDPITFTYDTITLHGIFHLLQGDALKDGMFYRMTHAKQHE